LSLITTNSVSRGTAIGLLSSSFRIQMSGILLRNHIRLFRMELSFSALMRDFMIGRSRGRIPPTVSSQARNKASCRVQCTLRRPSVGQKRHETNKRVGNFKAMIIIATIHRARTRSSNNSTPQGRESLDLGLLCDLTRGTIINIHAP